MEKTFDSLLFEYNIITRYNIPQFYYKGVCVCGYLLCGLMIIVETDKHINIDTVKIKTNTT